MRWLYRFAIALILTFSCAGAGAVRLILPRELGKVSKITRTIPLVTFSSALQGSVPYSAYSQFLFTMSERVVIWETGNEHSATRSEIERVQKAMNLQFEPIVSIGHSTGVHVARRVISASKFVAIDPVEFEHELDGTSYSRARMRLIYEPKSADPDGMSTEYCVKDPFLVILSSQGDRVPYAHSDYIIRVKEMKYFDMFDERDRLILSGERSSEQTMAVKQWLINVIWSICGVGNDSKTIA